MGVRFRKYLSECEDIDCKGKKSKHCPTDRPRRLSGEYKKCGTWVVELFDESNRWKTLSFRDVRSKRDAEKRLALLIGDRERGLLKLPKKGKIPTLKEYCERYLEYSKNDKEKTFLNKVTTVKAISRHLGNYKLDKITKFILEKYRIERKEKDNVKDVTINLDMAILSHIFNGAISDGIIDKNICREVKRYKTDQKRKRVLTDEEVGLIINKLTGKDRLMILIGMLGGLRLNEVLKLEWKDIDLSRNVMTFLQSKTGKLIINPISTFLSQELYEYKKSNETDGCLFNNRIVNLSLISKYSAHFSRLFKSLGIKNFTFHSLRHCCSTFHSDTGADAFTTQALLGHASLAQTALYTNKQSEAKRKAVEAMTEHVLNIGQKAKITSFTGNRGTT